MGAGTLTFQDVDTNRDASAFVYGLHDPDTGELRYIGQTAQPLHRRLKTHVVEAKRGVRDHRCSWIKSLLSQGKKPEIRAIIQVPKWCVDDEEIYWIAFHRDLGTRLTNMLPGGNKPPSAAGRVWSEESRAKLGASNKGRKPAAHTIAASVAARKGKTTPDSHKLAIRRLSESQVVELRERVAAGEKIARISAEYGLGGPGASRITRGEVYAEFGGPITKTEYLSTEVVIAIREAVAAGQSKAEVARELGVGAVNVGQIASGQKYVNVGGPLSPCRPKKESLTDEQAMQIRELFGNGISREELREQFDITNASLSRILLGRSHVSAGGPIAETPYGKKLIPETALAIYNDVWKNGLSNEKAAVKYGVSAVTVGLIKSGKTWKEVTQKPPTT